MTVYVDPMADCIPNRNWRGTNACHLFATTLDELHAFAADIGLRRLWFQHKSHMPHYDLTSGKRRVAVSNGAVEVDRRTAVIEIWPVCEGYTGGRKPYVNVRERRVGDGQTCEDAGDVPRRPEQAGQD